MRIVGVVGHGNGAGKTLLLERILQAWPGRFAAAKFTTIFRDGQFCPRDQRRRCACSRLHGEHEVVADPAIVGQENTDTGRLLRAGARRVLWCLAREGHHEACWQDAREILAGEPELLTEGNTALLSIPADALLFIVNPCVPRSSWKPNWRPLAERAAAVLVNEAPEALGARPAADEDERAAALAEVQEAAPSTPRIVARLEAPLSEWGGPLLESLLGEGPATAASSGR